MLKSWGWWGGVVVAHVIIVSAPVHKIGKFFDLGLGLDLGSDLGTCWDGFGLGQPCMHQENPLAHVKIIMHPLIISKVN